MQTATATQNNAAQGFDQLATSLRTAVTEFERTASPQNLESVWSMLRPVKDSAQRALDFTVGYSRRHPIRMAVTVCALGLLTAKLIQRSLKA